MVVVVEGQHRSVDTRTQTLNFLQSEQLVRGGLTWLDFQVRGNGVHDAVRPAQLAWCGGTHLEVVLTHRLSVVHGVEGGHLVHSHWGHVQVLGDVVHDRNRGESELTLAQVQ